MTVVESVKDAVGLGHHGGVTEGGPKTRESSYTSNTTFLLSGRHGIAHAYNEQPRSQI